MQQSGRVSGIKWTNMNDIQINRSQHFIEDQIRQFDLDLSDLTIFTELGSNNYAFIPIIAAMANATKVYAIAKTSKYGIYEDILDDFRSILTIFKLPKKNEVIEIVNEKKQKHLAQSDIITNSGFVRPINRSDISVMKSTAVIPLMYETWEFRKEDIDLDYCRDKGILVLGINEECPPIDIMRYSGFLVSKLLFECGFGVHMDKILVLGSGRIGNNIADFFRHNKIDFDWMCLDTNIRPNNMSFIKSINDIRKNLGTYDAIIAAEIYHNIELIGKNGLISTSELSNKNPLVQIIHICGNIDLKDIKFYRLQIFPESIMPFGYMSATVNYLDPKATLQLLIGGLKVGEIMARNRLKYDFITAYKLSTAHPLVNDFNGGYIND